MPRLRGPAELRFQRRDHRARVNLAAGQERDFASTTHSWPTHITDSGPRPPTYRGVWCSRQIEPYRRVGERSPGLSRSSA